MRNLKTTDKIAIIGIICALACGAVQLIPAFGSWLGFNPLVSATTIPVLAANTTPTIAIPPLATPTTKPNPIATTTAIPNNTPTTVPTATPTPMPSNTQPPTPTSTPRPISTRFPPTITPTFTPASIAFLRDQVTTLWGDGTSGLEDWKKIIEVIEHLRQLDPSVEANNSFSPSSYKQKLYVAYLNYARTLENAGDKEGAAIQYAIALKLKPSGAEASIALTRLPPIPK